MSKNSKKELSRRKFIKSSTLVAVSGVAALGVGSVSLLRSDTLLLRPPGALDEGLFLASCFKCGQCLQVCPPQVIELAGISEGFAIGTPFITPRVGACILCAGLPCVLACPTGALDHQISDGKEAEMGLAVLEKPDTCLSLKGINDLVFRLEHLIKGDQQYTKNDITEITDIIKMLVKRIKPDEEASLLLLLNAKNSDIYEIEQLASKIDKGALIKLLNFTKSTEQTLLPCTICLSECPIKEVQPIVFEKKGENLFEPVVQKSCVGCGVCEEKCPTTPASITITPRLEWKNV